MKKLSVKTQKYAALLLALLLVLPINAQADEFNDPDLFVNRKESSEPSIPSAETGEHVSPFPSLDADNAASGEQLPSEEGSRVETVIPPSTAEERLPDESAEEEGSQSSGEPPAEDDASFVCDVPDPSGVFQLGGFDGLQTIPGEPMPLAANWEADAYRLILDAWKNQEAVCDVSSLGIAREPNIDAFLAFLPKVLNDHPELFYANKYELVRSVNGVISYIDLSYHSFPNGIDQAIRDFNAAVEDALSQTNGVTSELEKALLLHDWLVLNCDYNRPAATAIYQNKWNEFYKTTDNTHMWTAYGALVNKDPVCQGYALAYKYLLSLVGIDSIYLSSSSMNHGWNAVKIDGEWYHVDTTWDDPSPGTEGRCVYTYFLLSDATISGMSPKHTGWDTSLVTCDSTIYEEGWVFNGLRSSLYRRNGTYYYINPVQETYINPSNPSSSRTTEMNAVFQTSALDHEGQRLPGSLGWAGSGGVVWHENRLYLIPYVPNFQTGSTPERLLLTYDLDSGVIAQAGRFTYTPSPSADGHYPDALDRQLGLRYNGQTNEIEAVSPNHRTVAASFPVRALSGSWAVTEGLAPGAAPGLSPDGTAAVLYGPGFQGGGKLWAAFYQQGRFVALRQASIAEQMDGNLFLIAPPLGLVYLDTSGLPPYDSIRLMPLTDDLIPAGAAA